MLFEHDLRAVAEAYRRVRVAGGPDFRAFEAAAAVLVNRRPDLDAPAVRRLLGRSLDDAVGRFAPQAAA